MEYYDRIKKISKGNIRSPDEIGVSLVGGEEFVGFLMPSSGDENFLVLKLINGYNTGFSFSKIKKIVLVKKSLKKDVREFVSKKNDKPSISLVSTGGTIASKVDYRTGGVHMLSDPQEFLSIVPELNNIVNLKNIKTPFIKASEDMDFLDYQKLVSVIKKELESSEGVIVTHGTDTLHYTAAALSFAFSEVGKPIILVGAQRSSDRGSADGVLNMMCAAHLAVSDFSGVFVVMHENLNDDSCLAISGVRVRKLHTERRDAFKPVNERPFARIHSNGKIEVLSKKIKYRTNKIGNVKGKFSGDVALIKTYPNCDPSVIDFYLKKKVRGLIIEGTGFGHVPGIDSKRSWFNHIKKAVRKDVVVVQSTQAIFGRTSLNVYSNSRKLKELGMVGSEDMLSEVALIKLSWLLAQYKSVTNVKELFKKNFVGEISDRLEYVE